MAGKKDKNATLVGFFLFLGLVCLGVLIAQFSNIKGMWSGDYKINVIFGDASGLVKDSDVTRGGAKIGRVMGKPVMRADGQVQVTLSIKGDVKIMEGSSIAIYSVSLLGDKAVSIKEPDPPVNVYIEANRTVNGSGGGGFDEITSEAQNIAKNLNEGVTDIRNMVVTLQTKLKRMDTTVDGFDAMVVELTAALKNVNSGVLSEKNTKAVASAIANIENTSQTIKETAEKLKPFVKKFEPLVDEARVTMATVKKATVTAEKTFAKANEQIDALQPALKDVPETLKNIRVASAKATAMMDKVESIANDTQSVVASVKNGDGLIKTLTNDKKLKQDTKSFVKNLKEYGILRYRDDPTEKKKDPKRTRFRGERR